MKNKQVERILSGLLAIVLACLMFSEAPRIKNTQKLTFTSALLPRTVGILALLVGVPLVALGIFEILKQRKQGLLDVSGIFGGLSLKRLAQLLYKPAVCLILCAGFIIALRYVGTMIAGTLYLFSTFVFLSTDWKKSWIPISIISVTVPVFLYFLFTKAFGVVLPVGKWIIRLIYS